MHYQTFESIMRAFETGERLYSAIWLGSLFVWTGVFYFLYQMYRLSFLKFLLVAEVIWIAQWFRHHRHYFIGYPEPLAPEEDYFTRIITQTALEFGFRFIPLLLATIGTVMALRYLQNKWAMISKQENFSQTPPDETEVHVE